MRKSANTQNINCPNLPSAICSPHSDKDMKYDEQGGNGDLRNKSPIFPPLWNEIMDIVMNVAL